VLWADRFDGPPFLFIGVRHRGRRYIQRLFALLLAYWELCVGYYLPTTISLLEDMKAAVRLGDFFAILHAFGGSSVRHHNNVGAEHLELVFVRRVRSILHTGGGGFVVGNHLLLVLRFALGTDRK